MRGINKQYRNLIEKILKDGFEYEDPNRKGTNRKQIPFYRIEHDFKDGFPAIGLKQSYPKMAFNEMVLFMQGKTQIQDFWKLGVKFWDKDGYNYFLNRTQKDDYTFDEWKEFMKVFDSHTYGSLGRIYSHQIRKWNGNTDQLNNVLERLKKHPHSTKNIVTMWNPSDLEYCALSPCHRTFEFISDGKNLWVQWEQSSVDVGVGILMNIMYYSFVCEVFAHYLGLNAKGIIGNLSNVHLYDNSLEAMEEMLKRDENQIKEVPFLVKDLPTEWENLDDFLSQLKYGESVKLKNYQHLGRIDIEMLPYKK